MTKQHLLQASRSELRELITRGHPVDPAQLEGWAFRGVALGLPDFVAKLSWKTFQKTFHRDAHTGRLLGWNVRVHQDGVDAPSRPLEKKGRPWTTWHYEVVSPAGVRTPPGFDRGLLIDYGRGNNPALETVRFMKDPLVALEAGNTDLLLGVTWVSLGRVQLETPTYFLLEREHRISHVPPEATVPVHGPFFAFERRWAEQLFAALLGTGTQGIPPLAQLDRSGFWKRLEEDPPPYFGPGLRASIHTLTFLPLTLPGFRRPFYALDAEQQRRCVAQLAADRRVMVKQLLSTLKLLGCFALFEDPGVRRQLGGELTTERRMSA